MRGHWKEFQAAYEDAINECNSSRAPWHIVPANHKWYRNYIVAQTVVNALEKLKLQWPEPKIDVDRFRIK